MSKNKNKKDIISEQEFNLRMRSQGSLPEDDSPGDSEQDSGSEFLMGLNYIPEGGSEEPGEIVFSDEKSTSSSELPSSDKGPLLSDKKSKIEKAKVISSDLPSPWSDLDSDSDTH